MFQLYRQANVTFCGSSGRFLCGWLGVKNETSIYPPALFCPAVFGATVALVGEEKSIRLVNRTDKSSQSDESCTPVDCVSQVVCQLKHVSLINSTGLFCTEGGVSARSVGQLCNWCHPRLGETADTRGGWASSVVPCLWWIEDADQALIRPRVECSANLKPTVSVEVLVFKC